jgi:type IV pilus assembly protein PilP
MRSLMLALAFVLSLGAPLIGQAPKPAPAAPAPAAPAVDAAQPAPQPLPPVDSFTYNPEGRRDPFVSLLTAKTGERRGGHTGPEGLGLAGLGTDEISVRGVLQSAGGYVAMVQGPDNKTYLVRQNDKLFDGVIKAITAQGLVILQDVNDPLSLVKQKEVRKMLHGNEEGK